MVVGGRSGRGSGWVGGGGRLGVAVICGREEKHLKDLRGKAF